MADAATARVGSDLFIIDNTSSEWDVLRYLSGWCRLSRGLDVASAYVEIGALLALDGSWQQLDHVRILMGDEVAKRTKSAIVEALKERLDQSLEHQKLRDDFLDGVPAIVDAIKAGRIQFRVYRKTKFHAKAYITHAREEVVGSFALVGSSNFTRPGLTSNVELNVQITGSNVGLLQDWYERYWEEADDVTPEMLRVIERHIEPFTPFDIWSRSLSELFRHSAPPADVWAEDHSRMWSKLDRYQRDGFQMLMERAAKYDGAFLCDGVGLGKTFVGLMLLEKLIAHENKTVVLLVPKSARKAVWEASLRRYLPDILDDEGFGLHILQHTDLNSPKQAQRVAALTRRADAIVIDEAHNFRNPGIAGRGRLGKSRYRVLQELATGKRVFQLTATPVNNSLLDLMHLIELFSGNESKIRQQIGIHSLRGHFLALEKAVKAAAGVSEDAPEIDEDVTTGPGHDAFNTDKLVEALVVQRSRAYVKASQAIEARGAAIFPTREPPKVADYRLSDVQQRLLDEVVRAFDHQRALFRLAIYNPDDPEFRRVPLDRDDPEASFEAGRRGQVVALIKIGFLKRLESSTVAFDHSCQNLFLKLYAFVEKNIGDNHRAVWERWKAQQAPVIEHVRQAQAAWTGEEDDGEDLIDPELLEAMDALNDDIYFVDRIVEETRADLDQLCRLFDILREFTPAEDGKVKKLIELMLGDPVLAEHKVLIFSEFMATARYVKAQLLAAGFTNVEEVDSATSIDRGEVIKRFAPYYNGSSSAALAKEKAPETRILVSTDVLSEGLNLQDATRLINYDLHWNPVRLMQRIGRVDRRLNPEIEAQLVKDHPEVAPLRRTVAFWNFLPAQALTPYLKLYERVAGKVLRISKTFGIEGKKLLTAEDDYDDLRDLVSLDGEKSVEEELQLEWEKLKTDHPELEERVRGLPNRIFSGRKGQAEAATGVFFCVALPGVAPNAPLDAGPEDWKVEFGKASWFFVDHATGTVADGLTAIADAVRSTPDTPRRIVAPRDALAQARDAVLKHLRQGYLKQMQAPPGVEPVIKAWMEIN